jgi:Ca-activated chloride channel family protein
MGHGKFYRITDPSLLPQVFIKEAVTLRNTLIEERPVVPRMIGSPQAIGDLAELPMLHGMVATWPKPSPRVELPIVSSDTGEPILASWRCGLGQAVAFTSDADRRWASDWVASPLFDLFWAHVVRSVLRPQAPHGATASILPVGPGQAKIVIETALVDGETAPVPARTAALLGPDPKQPARAVRLQQTAASTYEGEFTISEQGAYLAAVPFAGESPSTITVAYIDAGSRELRNLQSNERAVSQVAMRTGGRVIAPFDASANLFDRADLRPQPVSLPLTEKLIGLALLTLLLDVAVRRLAWDLHTLGSARASIGEYVRSFTQVRVGDAEFSLGALLYVHHELAAHQKDKFQAARPRAPRVEISSPCVTSTMIAPTTAEISSAEPTTTPVESPSGFLPRLAAAKRRAHNDLCRTRL